MYSTINGLSKDFPLRLLFNYQKFKFNYLYSILIENLYYKAIMERELIMKSLDAKSAKFVYRSQFSHFKETFFRQIGHSATMIR